MLKFNICSPNKQNSWPIVFLAVSMLLAIWLVHHYVYVRVFRQCILPNPCRLWKGYFGWQSKVCTALGTRRLHMGRSGESLKKINVSKVRVDNSTKYRSVTGVQYMSSSTCAALPPSASSDIPAFSFVLIFFSVGSRNCSYFIPVLQFVLRSNGDLVALMINSISLRPFPNPTGLYWLSMSAHLAEPTRLSGFCTRCRPPESTTICTGWYWDICLCLLQSLRTAVLHQILIAISIMSHRTFSVSLPPRTDGTNHITL